MIRGLTRTAFLLAMALSLPLGAQDSPIFADRPGFADGPDVVGARRVQIEFGLSLEEDDERDVSTPTLLRFGITKALELRLETSDFEEVAAGMKLRLREGDMPLSLIASVQREEGQVRLVSSLDLGGGFSVVPNIGAAIAEGESAALVLAASLEKESGDFVPFVDFEFQGGDEQSAIVDGGVAWTPNSETQLDVSGGVRVSGDGYPEWFVSAGVSRRF